MMPSKTKSEKSTRSRSRSTSRSRASRSSSRTRRSSRSRASDSASRDGSPPSPAKSSLTKKSSKASKVSTSSSKTSSSAAGDEVREQQIVNAVSTRVESGESKAVERSEEKITRANRTETVVVRRTTASAVSQETSETTPLRVSSRLREKRGEIDHCTLESIPESRSTKKRKFVLGGPWFPILLVLAIPLLSVYLSLMCSKRKCVPRLLSPPMQLASYWNFKTFMIYVGWVVFQAALCLVPLGRVYKGLVSKNGSHLNYRCNGFIGFLITILFIGGMVLAHSRWPQRVPPVTSALDHFLPLQVSAIIVAFLTGLYVYISSRLYARERDLNPIGNSGNVLYDACVGHELHPRIFGGLDIKFFTMSRLSLISTATLVILFAMKDYENRGGWNQNAAMNVPLLLVAMQQLIFVADSLFFEDSFLTSFAMQREGFGLLHSFTRLVWIPFITTMPARQLMYVGTTDSPAWSSYAYVGIVLLHLVAFVIHRGAISQKSDYRREPNHPVFASLETVPVSSSSKRLLAGGWWGLVRHPNYLGELLLYVAWTLPVGVGMTTSWLCPLLLLLVFVVRIRMVESLCAQRYGSGWKAYCEKVRSRLVPYIL